MTLHQDTFVPDLKFGVGWQVEIAKRFSLAGLNVNSLDDDPSEALKRNGPTTEFANTDDLVVEGWPIEVKAMKKVSFTCREDIRFPMIRIGRIEAWQRKKIWPLAVVMVSGPTREAIVLPVRSTRERWSQETINVRGFSETMYAARREWFRPFPDLIEWLSKNSEL